MFGWAKNAVQAGLSQVAGTAEPIYGAEALHSVSKTLSTNPSSTLAADGADLKWQVLDYTNVETSTFYITCDAGHYLICQVIYSNVFGVHITLQFTAKLIRQDGTVVWSSTTTTGHGFSEDRLEVWADEMLVTYNQEKGEETITVKSAVDKEFGVDIVVKRKGPGVKLGNGKSGFGTDEKNPWGYIRHVFWPRSEVTGRIIVGKEGSKETIDCKGMGLHVMAMQAMKPHHAAARWNFTTFQGPTHSAVMMEFTTPPSYGSTTVNVSAIVSDTEIVYASTSGTAEHTKSTPNEDAGWPEPNVIDFKFTETEREGKKVSGRMNTEFEKRTDLVDVMGEVPPMIKKVVAASVGTKPYVYQFRQKTKLEINVDGQVSSEEGLSFSEATFIS